MCENVRGPTVLHNPSVSEFAELAYASKPIVVKGGAGK